MKLDRIVSSSFSREVWLTPSVHFLVRQAARERLSATRSLNPDAKARHQAMAELYMHRAKQLQSHVGENSSSDNDN
jgi:hypothetical protein